jgi:hypothetical protein
MLTVEEARERRVCRVCEIPIIGVLAPMGWAHEYGHMTYPDRITLNFGEEFAHTACLEAQGAPGGPDGPEDAR